MEQISLPIEIATTKPLFLGFIAADRALQPDYPLTHKTINAANRLALLKVSGSDPNFQEQLVYIAAAKRTLLRAAGNKCNV